MDALLLTGGTNGNINFWDIKNKNTLGNIKLNSPVICFDFSPNGNTMIFATGNDWCLGINGLG